MKPPATPPATVEQSVKTNLEFLHRSGDLDQRLSSLGDVALLLARMLDDGAGVGTASITKELRATLEAIIMETHTADDTTLAELLARMSTPLGNPAH